MAIIVKYCRTELLFVRFAKSPEITYNEKTSSEPVFAGASIRRRIEVLAHGFGPVEVAAQIRVDLER